MYFYGNYCILNNKQFEYMHASQVLVLKVYPVTVLEPLSSVWMSLRVSRRFCSHWFLVGMVLAFNLGWTMKALRFFLRLYVTSGDAAKHYLSHSLAIRIACYFCKMLWMIVSAFQVFILNDGVFDYFLTNRLFMASVRVKLKPYFFISEYFFFPEKSRRFASISRNVTIK